jgi:hypothetical protein
VDLGRLLKLQLSRFNSIDEALVALVFAYAMCHTYLDEIKVLDWRLLDLRHELTSSFEVGKRSLYE